jgi:RND family efflux transporter MFP subunit
LAGVLAAAGLGLASDLARGAEFDCLIEPSQTVELRSPVGGVIEKVHVQRGSVVRRGAPLVSLLSDVERSAVELAKYKSEVTGPLQSADSRLAHAELKLKRRAGLAESRYASEQDKEDADAERAAAAADIVVARESRQVAALEYANAAAQLSLRTINSPIDGVVVDQAMFPGEFSEPREGKAYILKLAQITPLRVKLILPVALYPKVRAGQRAEVMPEKPIEGRYPATVGVVDKVIDAASGTFQVRLDLPNANGALPAGLRCKASLAGV